jgi:hypothetical protein
MQLEHLVHKLLQRTFVLAYGYKSFCDRYVQELVTILANVVAKHDINAIMAESLGDFLSGSAIVVCPLEPSERRW